MTSRALVSALRILPLLLLCSSPVLAAGPKQAMVGVLASDPRNAGIEMSAYWESMVSSNAIVISIDDIRQSKAPVDIVRVLYQFASQMSGDSRFKIVKLARNGEVRFLLEGDYFRSIGREYAAGQNPVYLMRTLAQNVYQLDGKAAFGTWSGGMLAVVSRQMDDLNSFVIQWAGRR